MEIVYATDRSFKVPRWLCDRVRSALKGSPDLTFPGSLSRLYRVAGKAGVVIDHPGRIESSLTWEPYSVDVEKVRELAIRLGCRYEIRDESPRGANKLVILKP